MAKFTDFLNEDNTQETQKVSIDSIYQSFENTINSHLKLFENMFEGFVAKICKEYGYKSSEFNPSFNISSDVFTMTRDMKISPSPKAEDFEKFLKILKLNIENKIGYGIESEKISGGYKLTFNPQQDRDSATPNIASMKNKFDVLKIMITRELDSLIQKLCGKLNNVLIKKGYKIIPIKIDKFTTKIFNKQFEAKIQKFGKSDDSKFKLGRTITKNIDSSKFSFTVTESGILRITLLGITNG